MLSHSPQFLTFQDDDEAGLLEKVKTGICEIVELFAKKYEDEFTDLPVFVETIWSLLITTGLELRNDLVSFIYLFFRMANSLKRID